MNKLLTRDEFRDSVLKRDGYKCVFCPCVDNLAVHHIIERKLFDDGGYYLDNGASLCEKCHLKAEKAIESYLPREVRDACGIENVVLPKELDLSHEYDKWGNRILIRAKLYQYNETTYKSFKKISHRYSIRHVGKDYAKNHLNFDTDCDRLIVLKRLNETNED